jgi:uncharacterized membrane protein YozB (DUF420 family)
MVDVILATVSLVVQIFVLALLIAGYVLKGRKNYRGHGITMTTAVILHIITILTVMAPSFSSFFSSPGTIVIDAIVIISFVHVALGLIAVALGIWLTASWHFKKDLQTCFSKKKVMKPTLTLWVTAILLGLTMYITFWAGTLLS